MSRPSQADCTAALRILSGAGDRRLSLSPPEFDALRNIALASLTGESVPDADLASARSIMARYEDSESALSATAAERMIRSGGAPLASGPPARLGLIDTRVVAVSTKKLAKARDRPIPASARREEPHLPLAVLTVLVFAAALAAYLLATPTFRPLRFSEAEASCQSLLRVVPIAREANAPAHT